MAQIVLQGLLNECCLVYLDDVIIFSKNWKNHLHHLNLVLERLTIHGLACSLDKCCFAKREVQYLGHLVSANKNSTQDSHIKAIQEASPPSSKRELQRFLGICGWVREYVPGYSEITAPLTNLLRKHTGKWRWTAEAEEAFHRLKKEFETPLTLARPDPHLEYTLQTQTSNIGMSAVLFQVKMDGTRSIISYGSAKFSPAELRYEQTERDCLAVIWGLKKYKAYLLSRHFILLTDTTSLNWQSQFKNTAAKLGRWACLLGEFSFTLRHCPRSQTALPSALAGMPNEDELIETLDDEDHLPSRSPPIGNQSPKGKCVPRKRRLSSKPTS